MLGPSCFTKFTLVLKISKRQCQLVQFSSLMCDDTACQNGAFGCWVGVCVYVCVCVCVCVCVGGGGGDECGSSNK